MFRRQKPNNTVRGVVKEMEEDINMSSDDYKRDEDIERKIRAGELKECRDCHVIYTPYAQYDDGGLCENCLSNQEGNIDTDVPGEADEGLSKYYGMK